MPSPRLGSLFFLLGLLATSSCRTTSGPSGAEVPTEPSAAQPVVATIGEEIVICGRRIHVGAPVVTFDMPGAYDAYSTELRFEAPVGADTVPDGKLRYQPGRVERDGMARVRVEPETEEFTTLAETVDHLVLHYDACGTSRTCFKVLHDRRALSCHFLLDLDGTIYQTLDLREQAWHATKANVRSIGVEIANIGAYPPGRATPMDDWYTLDEQGTRLVLNDARRLGLRQEFSERPAVDERVSASINGGLYEMHDLTPEQYDSLVKLTVALCKAFPRLEPKLPRDAQGNVLLDVMGDASYDSFRGILGHFHVQRNKVDPGPAFQWEPYLARVRARLMVEAP